MVQKYLIDLIYANFSSPYPDVSGRSKGEGTWNGLREELLKEVGSKEKFIPNATEL